MFKDKRILVIGSEKWENQIKEFYCQEIQKNFSFDEPEKYDIVCIETDGTDKEIIQKCFYFLSNGGIMVLKADKEEIAKREMEMLCLDNIHTKKGFLFGTITITGEKKKDSWMEQISKENNQLIDEESLLKESNLEEKKLRKKKCKNCTCGSSDQKEEKNFKSKCGSCYLGDAFRCESCPYIGMPAFKPGEEVVFETEFFE